MTCEQECVAVGCVPIAAVATGGLPSGEGICPGGVCLGGWGVLPRGVCLVGSAQGSLHRVGGLPRGYTHGGLPRGSA